MNVKIHPDIYRIKEFIIQTRREIHQNPELSFKEFDTSNLIIKNLEDWGVDVKKNIAKTGVLGTIQGSSNRKTIALRADMDALPIQETSNVSYKSKNDGVMHACGHDGHIAMLLGAAKVLAKKKAKLNGTIKFIFQPAEEGHAGAKHMVNEGVLKGVDEIYGSHLWNYQNCGTIGVKPGPIMAAADIFKITIHGKGGHGATPHGTIDSILISSHLIQALQSIVSRNTNPLESTVVSIGKINGGYNFNIIADNVILEGTTRSYTEENRQLIKQRMNEIIKGIEASFNASIKLEYTDGYPPTINDSKTTENLLSAAKMIVKHNAQEPYLSMGGEDFSYFANEIPACFFFVGSAPKNTKPLSVPHHCSHFDIDENALLIGSSVFVQLIENQLIHN